MQAPHSTQKSVSKYQVPFQQFVGCTNRLVEDPMEEHALLIDVSVFTLHRELHLMPKWHAKAFITPFIMISAANLVDVRRPIDSGMETPLDTNTSSQPKIFEI